MTTIASGNAALTILQQAAPLASAPGRSATDTILDIVSGRISSGTVSQASETVEKAAPEASKGPREVGGTVSSEISKAQMSAMSAAGRATVNGISYDDPRIAFTPVKASMENAEAWIGRLALTVSNYNRQFDLQEIPSREEHMAGKDAYMARVVASGASQKIIENTERGRYGEGGYERTVRWINEENTTAVRAADWTESSIVNFTMLLGQTFGKEVSIIKDDKGRLTLGALDIFYGNGQKMVSFTEDGVLTSFNEDGSQNRSLSGKDLLLL